MSKKVGIIAGKGKAGSVAAFVGGSLEGLNETQIAAITAAVRIFSIEQRYFGHMLELLTFKRDKTVQKIKSSQHGMCDCGKSVDIEALQKLEIFCPDCLSIQTKQTAFLTGLLAPLQLEYSQVSGAGISELRDNSRNLVANHAFEHAPTVINATLSVRAPILANKINAIQELLQKVPFGQYGLCEECGEKIPQKRLEKHPDSRHCVGCLSDIEKTSGNGRIRAHI